MAWGLEATYLSVVALFQLVLAGLVVGVRSPNRQRVAFGLVLGLGALEVANRLFATQGLPALPDAVVFEVDMLLVWTLAFLATQLPTPWGGKAGQRWATRLWIGLPLTWFSLATLVHFTVSPGLDGGWRRIDQAIHYLGFPVAVIAGVLHLVPQWFDLDPGPLQEQTWLAGAGVLLSPFFVLGTRLDNLAGDLLSYTVESGVMGPLRSTLAWFAAATVARLSWEGIKGNARALAFAGLLALGAGMGLLRGMTQLDLSGYPQLAAEVLRPVLIAVAMLRWDLFRVPESLRRPATALTALATVVLGFLLLVIVFPPRGYTQSRIGPVTAVLAVAIVAIGGLAWMRYTDDPVAIGDGHARRLDRYRLALERADAGEIERARLAELRERLGVTDTEHELLSALVRQGDPRPSQAVAAAQPGDVIGDRYEVDRELGRGGEGRALAAWDRETGQQVVLKEVVRPWEEGAQARREALERGAELLGGLDEPGLATIHGLVEDGPRVYLVRSYVPGPTLDQVIDEEGPLSPSRAASLAAQLAQTLGRLHDEGLLHLDLKPSNVVLRDGQAPVVIDHGTVQQVDAGGSDRIDATSTIGGSSPRGTLAWMAPEQVLDEPLDPRTDVFALGALLYAMLEGEPHVDLDRPPFQVEEEIVHGSPPRDLEGPLGDVVAACLARDRDQRPSSMEAVADRLVEPRGAERSRGP